MSNYNVTELSDHDLLVKTIETLKVMGENIALLVQDKAHRDLKESGKEARIRHLDDLLRSAPDILPYLPRERNFIWGMDPYSVSLDDLKRAFPQWAQDLGREPLARKDDDIGIDPFNMSTERLVNRMVQVDLDRLGSDKVWMRLPDGMAEEQIVAHLTSYWRQRLARKDPEPVQTHWTAEEEAILCDRGRECIDIGDPFVDWLVKNIAKEAKAKEDTQKLEPEIVKPWQPSDSERPYDLRVNFRTLSIRRDALNSSANDYLKWLETLDYCIAIAREFTDSQKPWGQRGLWTPAYLTYANGTRAEWRSKCSAFPELFRFELLESCDKFILSVGVDRLNLVFGVKG